MEAKALGLAYIHCPNATSAKRACFAQLASCHCIKATINRPAELSGALCMSFDRRNVSNRNTNACYPILQYVRMLPRLIALLGYYLQKGLPMAEHALATAAQPASQAIHQCAASQLKQRITNRSRGEAPALEFQANTCASISAKRPQGAPCGRRAAHCSRCIPTACGGCELWQGRCHSKVPGCRLSSVPTYARRSSQARKKECTAGGNHILRDGRSHIEVRLKR
jgi:hypothetical protein